MGTKPACRIRLLPVTDRQTVFEINGPSDEWAPSTFSDEGLVHSSRRRFVTVKNRTNYVEWLSRFFFCVFYVLRPN